MVKSSNYDFRKYKKETDYQAEINKALQEGDYYGAAVNEQFRNTKIELEGLGDKYKPTSKYLYCINPDGTKNEAEVAKFEAQQGKTDGTKVIDPVPNDYLGMYDSMTVHTEDNGGNYKKINEHQTEVKEDIDCTYCAEETPKNISTQPKLQGEDETENESYYESFGKWLYQEPTEESYSAFMQNVAGFLDMVDSEMQNREGTYTQKNEYNSMYSKRSEQLYLVIDWGNQIIDMLEEHNDGSESSQIIMETTDLIRGYREKAEHLLYKMNSEKTETDKYTTENHWLTYTDPAGALEKINSADMKNLTDAEKADIEELTKWLSQYNTERALVDALTLMGEGKTYEELEAERDLTKKRLGELRTGEGIYRSETTAFEKNLIKGYENYLAYLDMIMGFFEDVKYMSYRNREDYYSLGIPKVPRGLKDSEKKGIAEQNYNKPYYYINDIFESRDEYKVNALLQEEDLTKYNYMTEAEIRTYNYIYATEGEKSANKYLDYLTDQKSYWVNEQGEYVLSETGLNYRKGKNMAQNANWLDYIEIMAKSGTDSYANRIKQLFTKDPLPKSEYEYAYEYLYNNASENGKNIMGVANDVIKKLPITAIGGAAEQMGIPMIGTIAGTIYDCLDANYKAVQEGVAPIERSNRIISAAVKSVGTSAITGIVQKMLPQMSDEVKEMWTSNGNDFIKLLKKLELYVLDSTTEDEITKIVESWFNDVDDRNVNVEDAARLSYYKIIESLNQDQTFQDNKYSQFSRHEQEMLKLLEKSYKAGTIVKQEYESEIRRFAHHMKKDSKEYLDYIKLLGIL